MNVIRMEKKAGGQNGKASHTWRKLRAKTLLRLCMGESPEQGVGCE